jgi:hypothetical protein
MRSNVALESWVYERVVCGVPGFAPIQSLTREFQSRHACPKKQTSRLVRWHAMHAGSVALLTSWGGFATLPVSLSVNFIAERFLAFRLVAGVAALNDWSLESEETFRKVSACVADRPMVDELNDQRVASSPLKHQIVRHVAKGVGGELVSHGRSLLLKEVGKGSLKSVSRAVPILSVAVSVGMDTHSMYRLGARARTVFHSSAGLRVAGNEKAPTYQFVQ